MKWRCFLFWVLPWEKNHACDPAFCALRLPLLLLPLTLSSALSSSSLFLAFSLKPSPTRRRPASLKIESSSAYPRSPGSSSEEQRFASGGCSRRQRCPRDESMSRLRSGRAREGGALRCARRSTDDRAETCRRGTWPEASPARYPLP